MKKLFGTDGIRGKAGHFPLDRETITKVGRCLATRLKEHSTCPRLLVGRDTRESGTWIEEALSDGIKQMGGVVHSAGVLPTPGVAILTRRLNYDGGVVLSASHNPFEDNGIKIFSASGFKLHDMEEAELEQMIEQDTTKGMAQTSVNDSPLSPAELRQAYLDILCAAKVEGTELKGKHVVVDCANGAASGLATELYTSLGLEVTSLHDTPDGRNINLNCGSLHPETLSRIVLENNADVGIAFDGDADRALFIDRRGTLMDGDHILYLCGVYLKELGVLYDSRLVTTVMANIGLELALSREQIIMDRTQVGDKYVLERMVECGSVLGGEQSGHIIFLQNATTGDGLLTGLKVLEVMAHTGKPLEELARPMVKYPQVLLNIPVPKKPDIQTLPEVVKKIKDVENEMDGKGRVLVRYSGTENLARVMVEGKEQNVIDRLAREIVVEIERSISALSSS